MSKKKPLPTGPRRGQDTLVRKVLALVAQHGPIAVAELEALSGISGKQITTVISGERCERHGGMCVYIASWDWVQSHGRLVFRARYAVPRDGRTRPDQPKPDPRPRRPRPRVAQDRIEAAIKEEGPSTGAHLSAVLDMTASQLYRALVELRRRKRVFIASYTRELQPGRKNIRAQAVFALGDGKDARKPPPLPTADNSRRQRERLKRVAPSVFHLAVPIHKRRLGTRAIPT